MAQQSNQQIESRFDRLLDAMLTVPPDQVTPPVPEFVLMGGKFWVADIKKRGKRTITADLYRNMDDYREGTVTVRSARLAV